MAEEDYNRLKAENAHYKQILGIGDIATRCYKTMVKILEQQEKLLNDVTIKSIIGSDDKKDTIMYKNTKDLWEGMPDTVMKLNKMKNELGIEYVEKEEEMMPVSPQSIGRLNNSK